MAHSDRTWYSFPVYLQKNSEITEDGCWLWQGAVHDNGDDGSPSNIPSIYRTCEGKRYRGQAAIYAIINKKPPPGNRVSMSCGNRRCVNPDHATFIHWEPKPIIHDPMSGLKEAS